MSTVTRAIPVSTMQIVENCLSESYPMVLEQWGLSFTTYLAVRRQRKFPPRNNLIRRNMEVRRRVLEAVHRHPEWNYRDVAAELTLSLPCVWKIFTDYMLHDENIRLRISKIQVELM